MYRLLLQLLRNTADIKQEKNKTILTLFISDKQEKQKAQLHNKLSQQHKGRDYHEEHYITEIRLLSEYLGIMQQINLRLNILTQMDNQQISHESLQQIYQLS